MNTIFNQIQNSHKAAQAAEAVEEFKRKIDGIQREFDIDLEGIKKNALKKIEEEVDKSESGDLNNIAKQIEKTE